MPETTADVSPTVALLRKLAAVRDSIGFIEKRGRNDHHQYNFAQAVDVKRDVRAALATHGLFYTVETVPGSIRQHVETGGKAFLTTVDLDYTVYDVETGVSITLGWTGAGADTGGDKGLYKAYTGAEKYLLLSLFMLPTTDDPEHDALTAPNAAEGQSASVQADAERPAAPQIPADRAKLILDAAADAGLAQIDPDGGEVTFSPILRAKLADVGVGRIGHLNVDQAEDVEAFIAAEKAGGGS